MTARPPLHLLDNPHATTPFVINKSTRTSNLMDGQTYSLQRGRSTVPPRLKSSWMVSTPDHNLSLLPLFYEVQRGEERRGRDREKLLFAAVKATPQETTVKHKLSK